MEKFTKKERARFDNQAARLNKVLGGIKEMKHLPALIFIIDPAREMIAVREARRLGIPVIAITGTATPDGAKQATVLIERFGGKVVDHVSIDTDFVVRGEEPPEPENPEPDLPGTIDV